MLFSPFLAWISAPNSAFLSYFLDFSIPHSFQTFQFLILFTWFIVKSFLTYRLENFWKVTFRQFLKLQSKTWIWTAEKSNWLFGTQQVKKVTKGCGLYLIQKPTFFSLPSVLTSKLQFFTFNFHNKTSHFIGTFALWTHATFCLFFSPDSLVNVEAKWVKEVRHFCNNAPIILVGNKLDLRVNAKEKETIIQTSKTKSVASKISANAWIECSAKTQENIKELFTLAAKTALKKRGQEKKKKESICLLLWF